MHDECELAADILLDKIASLYPYGIPSGVVRAPASKCGAEVAYSCPIRCVLCVVTPTGLRPQEQELLTNIAQKGLKLTDGYAIEVVPSLEGARARVAELKSLGEAKLVVVFGTKEPAAEAVKSGPLMVLGTHAVSEIAANAEIKKIFWRHLQGVLPSLSTS